MTTFATLLILLLLMTSLLAYAAGDRFTSMPRRVLHRHPASDGTYVAPTTPPTRSAYGRAA